MKKTILIIIICGFMGLGLTGCGEKKKEKADYSEYSFTNIWWTRDTENDTETIRFAADGFFNYSCACGNPVNDSDICENYIYDDENKIIKLKCSESMPETITNIKLVSYDENNLVLDFDGDIRKFIKEK